MSNSIPPSALLPEYQNPTYPADALLTDDQIAAKMRARSLVRAQSPGEHICMMDGTSDWLTPAHTHPYDEFMAYRRSHLDTEGHIIADGEPWINWEPYDVWADHAPIPELPPDVAVMPPSGWQPIFSVRPGGIAYPTSNTGQPWSQYGLAVEIDGNRAMRRDPCVALRVHILMWGQAMSMIGLGPRTNKPFVATSLTPVLFKGQNQISSASWGEYTSDPIVGVDFRAGLHFSWFSPGTWYGCSNVVPGWNTRYSYGVWNYDPRLIPTTLDKSSWTPYPSVNSIALFLIEGLFPHHPEAIQMQVFKRYSIGSPDFGTAPPPKLLT